MTAYGTFATTDYAAMRSRMIIRTAPKTTTTTTTTAPPRVGVAPPRGIPAPTTATGDPVISAPQSIPGGPVIIQDTFGTTGGSTGSTGSTGGTSGTVTDPGSTGGSSNDTALLLNALGSLFKSQEVGQSMAPVSFAPTDGGGATTTDGGGGSKVGAILFLAVLVIGGAYWYTHR